MSRPAEDAGDDRESPRILRLRLAWELGDTVYHRTLREPDPGMITGYQVRPGVTLYLVTWGDLRETAHYEFELTESPPLG